MTGISISSFLVFNLLIKPLKVFLNAQIDVHYKTMTHFLSFLWDDIQEVFFKYI